MKRFKLTHMQETMLYEAAASSQDALAGSSRSERSVSTGRYISVLKYELSKHVDMQQLNSRIELLAERHEALRTTFVRDDDNIFWQEIGDVIDEKLFKLELSGSELTITFHHALFDGWSMGVIMRELLAEVEPSGKASPFRYYAKWLKKRKYADDLKWWKEYLDDITVCSELPIRTSKNPLKSDFQRQNLRFTIGGGSSAEKSELLRNTARELRITAGRLIQAIWSMLIARYNGGESLVCNTISGRSAPVPGIMGMVGMCVNTLPIVTRLPKPPESISFADWVHEWSKITAEAERHGFCSLGDLITGPMPHILSIDPSLDGNGYTLKSTNAELVTDFDVAITLGDEIKVEFAYNSYAYSDEDIKAVQGHFITALNAVLDNPQIAVENIPILTAEEIAELTAPNENAEILNIIEHKTVVDFCRESIKAHGNREAIVCGDIRITYSELSCAVEKLSCALKNNGVKTEIPVAILLPRSERYVIAELAVMTAGGMFIPLDPDWPEERIKLILKETNPKLIIDEETYNNLLALNTQFSTFNSPKPRDAAYMIMTSGTTGTPKGVVAEHRSFANLCLWAKERYGWQPGDSCTLELGFTFDGAMWDIWLPLISGGTLHILRDDIRFNIGALGDYCRAEHITHLDLPVTMTDAFREIYQGENALPDLRVMVTGGEEVRRVVPAPYLLSNEYGPTECTVCCSVGWISEEDCPITVGSPPPNMNVYILDEWRRLCPDGVTGEAYFSGVQVTRGYYNSPELTAERFIANPFENENQNYKVMYRSGDLIKKINRNNRRELLFMGRADNQVKVNGFRIELAEIENILREHSGVKSAVAAIRETPAGEKRLCAYAVPKNSSLEVSELYGLIASKLPPFMRPAITLVDKIPLTSGGGNKVDLAQLSLLTTENIIPTAEPVTENEKVLVAVISRLLGVSDIGINHNYLEIGGNSINAMRIAFCLEKEGYSLPAKELINSVSIGSAAAKMSRVTPINIAEYQKNTFTPLSAQQAFVFLAKTVSPKMYTVTLTLDAAGLDIETLKERLDKAAKLHDILRTVFEHGENGKIIGRVHDTHRIQINAEDSNGLEGIDPLRGPLLDLKLHNDKLTLHYHHIALDGPSVNLLIDELLFNKFPETAPSFAEFANRLAAQTERQAEDESWWRENNRDITIAPLLPPKNEKFYLKSSLNRISDFPTQEKKPEYKKLTCCSPELLYKCKNAARNARCTSAAFALAAWGVVVNALNTESGDGGVLIPFVASCREDGNLMGMCAAARPFLFRPMEKNFGELARNVQTAMLESFSHWFVPQDIIGAMPEYLFVFDEVAGEPVAGIASSAEGDQNYDLVIKFSDAGELIYNAARIPEEKAQKLAAYLEAALDAATEDRVSILCKDELKLVTKSFVRGKSIVVKFETAAQAFITAVKTYPDYVALETENESLTYSQVYKRSKKLADELNAANIGAGDIVAFSLSRNAGGIVAQIGITLSGAAFLPLEPAWPEGRINDILNDSGAAAVIRNGSDCLGGQCSQSDAASLNIEFTNAEGKVPTDSAYIIYTSGTTGRPKGVVVPQIALSNQIAWAIDEFRFRPKDKMLHYIAFSFDPSVWVLFTTLSSGGTLSLLPECTRLDPTAVARHIAKNNVTIATLPASVGPDILRRVEAKSLRLVFLGGEAIRNLPTGKRNYEIINSYGPTEACINATFYKLLLGETETFNIGRPVANTYCYVLDNRGEPCPIGIQGDLYIGGVQLAHGYLNRPDESAAAFVEHTSFGRIYKTGDRAAWKCDGALTFFGRADSQVKIRGNRVELGEIEYALREQPDIKDAKVKLLDGEICAYIIYKNNAEALNISDVRQKLSKRLPSYMLPRSVTVMEAFPLNQNGKIDFKAFPAPESSGADAVIIDENTGALNEIENAVAAAWKTALGLAPDFSIVRSDNFNELGGHSLLLFHVVGILSATGINADIRTLIEHQTLADLAESISQHKTIPSPKAIEYSKTNIEIYKQYMREMQNIDLAEKRPLRNILITGGTGFLGSHLIREFYEQSDAEIHLPVRGGIKKQQDVLCHYFGKLGAEIADSNRIHAYLADITEELPTIKAPLDVIYHSAADIRHYAPEPEMYRANVTATENMLELAERHNALLAHISTTSAVNSPFIHETDTDLGPAFDNIYQRTKQLAEQRIFYAGKRGLKYAVFRVGHISPGFESGSVARNWEINAMLQLINAMLLTELLPEQDYEIGYGYVDKISQAIMLLSKPTSLTGHIFHIDNPHVLRLSQIFKLGGLRGAVLPTDELIINLQRITASNDEVTKAAASEYLGRLTQGKFEKESADIIQGKLSMDATLLLLKRLGFEWSVVTADYIRSLIQSLRRKGR